MKIEDAKTARVWLAAWNGRPSSGVLTETIAGLRGARTIAECYGRSTRAFDAAISVLESARMTRVS